MIFLSIAREYAKCDDAKRECTECPIKHITRVKQTRKWNKQVERKLHTG